MSSSFLENLPEESLGESNDKSVAFSNMYDANIEITLLDNIACLL